MEDSVVERLILMPLAHPGPTRVLRQSDFDHESPMLSPDGRWLAFASRESGSWQVHVARFDTTVAGARQVTRGGLTSSFDWAWIRWSEAGREILYRAGDSVMRVPFNPATGTSGAPALLLRTPHFVVDVAGDGRRLLALATPVETAPRRIRVVTNWLAELEAKHER